MNTKEVLMSEHSVPLRELGPEEIFKVLQTSPKGLANEEVQDRFKKYGPNEIEEVGKTPLIFKFLANLFSPSFPLHINLLHIKRLVNAFKDVSPGIAC